MCKIIRLQLPCFPFGSLLSMKLDNFCSLGLKLIVSIQSFSMLIFSCISYQKPKICMNFKKRYIENYSREVPFCEYCVNGSLF